MRTDGCISQAVPNLIMVLKFVCLPKWDYSTAATAAAMVAFTALTNAAASRLQSLSCNCRCW
jgi:hypothetical protein